MTQAHLRATLSALLAALCLLLLPSAAHAASDGGHGIDWFVIGGSTVNFVILLFLIIKFGGPKIRDFLSSRKQTIERDIDEAAKLLKVAEEKLSEVERRAANINKELDEIRAEFTALAASERDQIIASAKLQADRMIVEAQQTIQNETIQAKHKLERDLLDLATSEAESILRQKLSPPLQSSIVDRYIDSLLALNDTQSN
jgi:F-type H+-transporting ATPase subunit b